jgi:hypothetical protein
VRLEEIRAGKPVIVEQKKLCGITVSSTVKPKPTPKEARQSELKAPASFINKWALYVCCIAVGVAVAFSNPFTQKLGGRVAMVTGGMWVASTAFLYAISYIGYILIGLIVLAVAALCYRTKGKSIIRYIKDRKND